MHQGEGEIGKKEADGCNLWQTNGRHNNHRTDTKSPERGNRKERVLMRSRTSAVHLCFATRFYYILFVVVGHLCVCVCLTKLEPPVQ